MAENSNGEDDLALAKRSGLPDTLQVLLAKHPRNQWEAHPEFGALTRFWLDRHLGFRSLLSSLQADVNARLTGVLDPQVFATALSRKASLFLNGLNEHHHIEDHHYFPKLVAHAPDLARGFDLLDGDHHRLHEEIERLAQTANTVLRGGEVGPLSDHLQTMAGFLDRHLIDEEELVVPVILEVGEAAI